MPEVLQTPTGQIVIGLAGLSVLTVIGAYIVLKFRGETDSIDSSESSAELLAKFREMRQDGHINEHEYRTIRTDLEAKLSKQSSVDADGLDLHG